ncbi:hypothetical protein AAFC00_001089 [Neodothiora populina]|uniref:Zn(2)-C6 fungal-type domain-containing protein n=1 Tax=Neodothiora populina TaxID=2781224 RepID=A0ABR3PMS6_9PEZI
MSSKRNVSILADQHHSHTLPPYHQTGYSTGPAILSPVVAAPASSQQHPPQNLPGLSSLSSTRFHPAQPPPPPPPPLHTTSHTPSTQSHPEAQDKPDHGYSGPHSGQATPTLRNHIEGPFQRTPSTPLLPPGQAPPPIERPLPMENGHHTQTLYAAHPPPPPPHHEPHHMMYPPQPHPGPAILEHGPYAPHPAYHPQSYLYPNMQHLANQNTRKKSMRASQACDKCRERKSKCDEQRPCSTCKEQNIECHYKDSQPSKVDKSNAQLAETMQTMVDQLKAMTDRIGSLEKQIQENGPVKKERSSAQPSLGDTPASADGQERQARVDKESRTAAVLDDSDYAEHTTAAHKLLWRWPSINRLIPEKDTIAENYPIDVEDRGCLRLYGRGEQRVLEENIAIGAVSPAAQSMGGDDLCNAPSPEMRSLFGRDESGRSESSSLARMEMDSTTLLRLYEQYKQHIHRLHPFLDIDNFGKYVKWFISMYSSDSSKHPVSPMFVNGISDNQRAGAKRKRSDNLGGSSYFCSSSDTSSKRRLQPERTVINAVVYLVFALGKVCGAVKIPGPLENENKSNIIGQSQTSDSPMNVKPSPSSPPSTTTSFTPPTGGDSKMDSRSSSFVEDSPSMSKKYVTNVDVIPGLDYYREAVSMLGDFADANDLPSAQARLLAALYKGQLSRVQESYNWLHLASRTCQYRIRREGLNKTYNPHKIFDKTKNLTLLAYWTCLQLESDILAELDYPHSGLSTLEGIVNWPNNVLDEEASRKIVSASATDLDMINIYYSAQLFLRKHLNQIHTRVYSVGLAKQDPKSLAGTLEDLDWTLTGWRALPHPITFWDDNEAPHHDILAARLRAKYYGARYVITRPFLDYALHIMEGANQGQKLEDLAKNAEGNIRQQELVLFKAIQMVSEDNIKEKVRICIESAIKSTTAFDEVDDHRLIVTNIMGTAHAQFGNILVLAATHTSRIGWLSALVSREDLGHYLERTIRFLRRIEDSSRTACLDLKILQDLQQYLDLSPDLYNPKATYTSR